MTTKSGGTQPSLSRRFILDFGVALIKVQKDQISRELYEKQLF